MKKKLSIITINYNNIEGLKRTVESVIYQTWYEFEYIIIDGGSTDGSVEYLQTQNEKIDYWISEPDKGVYNAMNKGITKAKGEYLLFLNSGDHFFSNNVLKENNDKIEKYDLIYCNLKVLGEKKPRVFSCPEQLKFSFMFLASLPHPATFIKASLFEEYGLYDENYNIVSDWKFFMLALFKHDCTYTKINQIISTFYADGISTDIANKELQTMERKKVLECDFKAYHEDMNELLELKLKILTLRKSRKLQLLQKLGLLNKF